MYIYTHAFPLGETPSVLYIMSVYIWLFRFNLTGFNLMEAHVEHSRTFHIFDQGFEFTLPKDNSPPTQGK